MFEGIERNRVCQMLLTDQVRCGLRIDLWVYQRCNTGRTYFDGEVKMDIWLKLVRENEKREIGDHIVIIYFSLELWYVACNELYEFWATCGLWIHPRDEELISKTAQFPLAYL